MNRERNRYGFVSKEEINQIHHKTGISKVVIKKCLVVFSKAFKKYLRGPMDLPFYILGIFTIYKSKGKKTKEMKENWRGSDKELPYKK